MDTLSKKTTGAAPTSGTLEERLLEARGIAIQWKTDCTLAHKEIERWKLRHANACASSLAIALASFLAGGGLGWLARGW